MNEVKLTVRCAAFGNVESHDVLVDVSESPRVRVWDPVGRIYTVCHRLTPKSEASIIRKARAAA
jgi:hypothetical protein